MMDVVEATRRMWDGAMADGMGGTGGEGGGPSPDPLAPAAALAGTVAHDLGNLLTVILGNAEMLIETLPDRPDVIEFATLILAAAQRGTELTERLDRLARRVPRAAEPTDAAAVLVAFARRLERELPAGIRLETSVPAVPGRLMMQPATLTMVLEELAANALAALRGQGHLRLSLSRDAEAGRIRLSVEDSGPGIAPETLRRIQEGRFTSGIAGHKTGIGLPFVQRVAAACQGSLSIDSTPGKGTRVTLDLGAKL